MYKIIENKKNRKDIIYPSPSWGYGELCLRDSFNILAQTLGIGFRDIDIENRQNSNFDLELSNIGVKYDTTSEDNVFLLVEVTGKTNLDDILKILNISGVMVSSNFAIIITPANKVNEISNIVLRIVNIEVSTILTLNAISPLEASGAPVFNNNPYLRLNGRGVLVGIIDTGIDYLNKEFQREDDTTRIVRIWDQTIQGNLDSRREI